MSNTRLAWLALSKLPGIGGKRCMDLVEYFGSAPRVLDCSDRWEEVLGAATARKARSEGIDWSWAEKQLAHLERLGGHLLTPEDERYPYHLRQIHQLPPVLFVLGEIPSAMPCVALVGTRQATSYGVGMARRLAGDLARAGVCVVSGLARGIDGAAHQGALNAGGQSVAVLGCGADVVYPAEHAKLYRALQQNGAVVSEFPMGSSPEPGSFPRRNRIISGLSLGVVVVEAPARSGALLTTNYAAEQDREVFAVPGDVRRGQSAGCHALLRDGAKLVERRRRYSGGVGCLCCASGWAACAPCTRTRVSSARASGSRPLGWGRAACGCPVHSSWFGARRLAWSAAQTRTSRSGSPAARKTLCAQCVGCSCCGFLLYLITLYIFLTSLYFQAKKRLRRRAHAKKVYFA